MPTYTYKCRACKLQMDIYSHSMTDPVEDPNKACPHCGGHLDRLIGSGGGIIFKGPGFYATDYRKGPKQ